MISFFRKLRQRLLAGNQLSKYLLYALGEILLVVIGILIALQVDNWNEERLNQERLRKYARVLMLDLRNDIKMVETSLFQASRNYRKIDSLRTYFSVTETQNLSNTDLYVLCHSITYRPFEWNRSTLEEIKASGSLRDMENDSLKKKIIEYEAFSYHMDEDLQFDRDLAQSASELMSQILYLNVPYFAQLRKLEREHPNDPNLDLFKTPAFAASKKNDHDLNSYDEQLLNTFLNTYIEIQDKYEIRVFEEMPRIIRDANEIIQMLQEEYHQP